MPVIHFGNGKIYLIKFRRDTKNMQEPMHPSESTQRFLNNVNASPNMLREDYLKKVKVLADIFRPYGIKVYLSVNFSSPKVLGGLQNSDPLNQDVQKWWKDKAAEIYKLIPDFGGFW
jgi:alpha-glucuronidase